MRVTFLILLFIPQIFACAGNLLLVDSFNETLNKVCAEIAESKNGLSILKMMQSLKDKIGTQKFGPIFDALATLPENHRNGIIGKVVEKYHYCFASLPPASLLDPLETRYADDEMFLEALDTALEDAKNKAPGLLRLPDHVSCSSFYDVFFSKREVNELMGFLNSFLENPEEYRAEINHMFPHPGTNENALKDAMTNILLFQRKIIEYNEIDIGKIDSLFRKVIDPNKLFVQLMMVNVHKYTCNLMLKMIDAGLRRNDRLAIAEVHGFVKEMSKIGGSTELPTAVMNGLYKIPYGPEREFAKWKLSLMSAKFIGERCKGFPEHWKHQRPLFYGLASRIMLSLRHCLSRQERHHPFYYVNDLFFDLQNVALKHSFPENITPKLAKEFIIGKVTKEIPQFVNKTPKFVGLVDLEEDQMDAILEISSIDNATHSNFLNFGGAEIVPIRKTDSPKKDAKDAKITKSGCTKKATRKRRNKLQAPLDQPHPRTSVLTPPAESSSDSAEETPEIKLADEESKADLVEKLIGKEEISEDSSSTSSVDDITNSELSIPNNAEYDKIQEEWRKIEEEQFQMIEHYKRLEKLRIDHAKLYRNNIHLRRSESLITRQKPRVVAFFHTDDLRQIFPDANSLYIDNQLNDTASKILNSGRSVTLKWIFNPTVQINRDHYQFLCQLFNLSGGVSHLNYKHFLSTFIALNPSKAKLTKRELARSVFQFEHAFETEDQVFVPPIGGGHREHLSSNFNHIEIRKFMMNGGAHPYFFKLN